MVGCLNLCLGFSKVNDYVQPLILLHFKDYGGCYSRTYHLKHVGTYVYIYVNIERWFFWIASIILIYKNSCLLLLFSLFLFLFLYLKASYLYFPFSYNKVVYMCVFICIHIGPFFICPYYLPFRIFSLCISSPQIFTPSVFMAYIFFYSLFFHTPLHFGLFIPSHFPFSVPCIFMHPYMKGKAHTYTYICNTCLHLLTYICT